MSALRNGKRLASAPRVLPRAVRRLPGCSYAGARIYFVTILTKQRRKHFLRCEVIQLCHSQILRAASLRGFALLAYCYMPDHLHLLVEGSTGDARLSVFMKMAKQLSAYHVKHAQGLRLWAKGYHDRLVREDEDPQRYVSYIRNNPVRAGLVSQPENYGFLWVDARYAKPVGATFRSRVPE